MSLSGPVAPYGMRKITIVPPTGSAVTLPWARTMKWAEEPETAELEGDDTVVASVTFLKKIDWELEAGGISLEAYAALTGRTVTAAGTTPNRTSTLKLRGGDAYPYVKIYGQVITDAGDVHIKFWKAKLSNIEGEFKGGEFFVTKATGVALEDTTNGMVDIVRNETSTNLPTT
jgi:hypothetical protein